MIGAVRLFRCFALQISHRSIFILFSFLKMNDDRQRWSAILKELQSFERMQGVKFEIIDITTRFIGLLRTSGYEPPSTITTAIENEQQFATGVCLKWLARGIYLSIWRGECILSFHGDGGGVDGTGGTKKEQHYIFHTLDDGVFEKLNSFFTINKKMD